MRRAFVAVVVSATLAGGPLVGTALCAEDPELAKGVALVDDGDYDSAILTLDTVARRLAQDPKQTRELSQAYLYLGIAYMGKGHEAAARAKFKEAIAQIKDLSLSPDKFPPKVIDAFEAAKEEATAAARATPAVAPPKEKKGGTGKLLLIGGGLAVAGGVAAAAGGGGSAGPTTTTLPRDSRNRLEFSGRLPNASGGSYDNYIVVATQPGTLEARVSWTNNQIEIGIGCCEGISCGNECAGTFNRTTNTSAVYTAPVTQRTYSIQIYNNFGTSDTYTVVILFP